MLARGEIVADAAAPDAGGTLLRIPFYMIFMKEKVEFVGMG